MFPSPLSVYMKASFAVVVWGASFIATKVALADLSPMAIVWLRFGMGVLILGAFVFRRGAFRPVRLQDAGMFALLGFIGITFHQWLQANGLLTAQASTTAWIVATTPIFMALFAQVWLRERLRPAEATGILLAALGVMLVAGKGDPAGLLRGTAGTSGDLLILISAPNWALFSVLSRRVLRSHPPAMAMFLVMLAGWLFTLPVPFTGGFFREVAAMSAPGWTAVLFLGVCCSGLAYIFWYDALEALPAARVGSLLYVEPLVAAGVAAWILDEPLLLVTFAGGALILGGVWLVNRAHPVRSSVIRNPASPCNLIRTPDIPCPPRTIRRCAWTGDHPLLIRYHDLEWGRPVHNDRRLFEMLTLEGAQAGLSWLTILRKRSAYRKAFDGFDPRKVARYDAGKVRALLQDAGIVRNRLKIESTVANARAFLRVQEEFGSFHEYLWALVEGKPVRSRWNSLRDLPARTPLSDALSKDLKKRGFRFVGSTICYAFLQAVGVVDDHLAGCFLQSRKRPFRAPRKA